MKETKSEPSKEIVIRDANITAVLVAGFQAKGLIKAEDWEKYAMFVRLLIESETNVVKLEFYKKGNEPEVEKKSEPVKKKGNVLYFPSKTI